uniref:Uncharacterized protein n=1 Tax=Caenorhabditis tropicalis TaxID=1561998 RepID=A0A1I7ULZ2_9PELO
MCLLSNWNWKSVIRFFFSFLLFIHHSFVSILQPFNSINQIGGSSQKMVSPMDSDEPRRRRGCARYLCCWRFLSFFNTFPKREKKKKKEARPIQFRTLLLFYPPPLHPPLKPQYLPKLFEVFENFETKIILKMNGNSHEKSNDLKEEDEETDGKGLGPGPSIHAAFVFDQFATGVEMM